MGTPYITENLLSSQEPPGVSIEYPHISLHALSKAEANDDYEDDSDNDVSELIFVSDDKTTLPALYEAIKQCHELHPDPVDVSMDEVEGFEDMIEDPYEDEMEAAADGNV